MKLAAVLLICANIFWAHLELSKENGDKAYDSISKIDSLKKMFQEIFEVVEGMLSLKTNLGA